MKQEKMIEKKRHQVPLVRDKDDTDTANKIVKMPHNIPLPTLPFILLWIQDGNWPVAKILMPYLSTLGEVAAKEITRVFSTDDDIWKYWCLQVLKMMNPSEYKCIKSELQLLAEHPTKGEKEEEIDVEALNLIDTINQIQIRA